MGDEQTIIARDKCRQVTDASPVMICLLDKHFNGLYFNQEWLSFTGRAEWDLLGNQWLNCIHPLDKERCIEVFRESAGKQQRYELEFRMQRHDGVFSHVGNIGAPQISEDGQLEGYLGTVIDKSASKAAAAVALNCEVAQTILHQLRCQLKSGPVPLRPLKLNKIISDVTALLDEEALLNQTRVILNLDPMLPQVEGDRTQLQQVILDLMVNAIEAMSGEAGKRELTIETRRLEADYIAMLVKDTGPGIPAEQMERIFEPFFTTKPNGPGMGLVICHSTIEGHHGKILVANNPQKGVTVSVVLPVFGGKWYDR